ncbi:hypothetical protein D3C76_1013990 [compost metagenome]
MADKKTGAGGGLHDVVAATARGVGGRISVELQVAVEHLCTGGNLGAVQVAQARRVAGDGRGPLGPGRRTSVGYARVVGGDFVQHDAAGVAGLLVHERQQRQGGNRQPMQVRLHKKSCNRKTTAMDRSWENGCDHGVKAVLPKSSLFPFFAAPTPPQASEKLQ